ncbi:hypothetical protein DYB28_011764, partial [Aphanomyces astaci]
MAYPGLTLMQPGDALKYLGIQTGQSIDPLAQAHQLNDKFLHSFLVWFRRARTLHGRKMVVHTQCLSLLWHYTAAVTIPQRMILSWQKLVNQFILGRKYSLDHKYHALISYRIAHDHKLGLAIPQIQRTIDKQRFVTLQK